MPEGYVCEECADFFTVKPHSVFRFGPGGTEQSKEFTFCDECAATVVDERAWSE